MAASLDIDLPGLNLQRVGSVGVCVLFNRIRIEWVGSCVAVSWGPQHV